MSLSPVLISWIAVQNDPYERNRETHDFILVDGQPNPGPTLTLLFDVESPYYGKIKDIVLLQRIVEGQYNTNERRAVSELTNVLKQKDTDLQVHNEQWAGSDPTDHMGIFEFLREQLPRIRKRFKGRELVIHISPGTPSMQTIWVLMAETGFIEPPFKVVKSYRSHERHGRPMIVPVEVGLDTFYKAYRTSHPSQVASEDQSISWDRSKFRTERMQNLFKEAQRFAQVKVPVLILGERGTGKTSLANWIRSHSEYRKKEIDGNWPSIACGQYSPETMRAELFGYKKGAFTGANSDKPGLLVAAHLDTLFLDEIGDISRDLQRLLIKAIEEKRYLPLGDDEVKASDFRLISATNLDDDELNRRLDPDFRDRVNALTLRLPPLREIRDELEWLWDSAFKVASMRAGASRRQVQFADSHHRRVVTRLREHPLPGNMRDLFRVAYRLIAARCDVHAPLSPEEAVDYGLDVLAEVTTTFGGTTSRAIARAFADSSPLDHVISLAGSVSTKDLERDLRVYVATEVRRIAKTTKRPIDELCDMTGRTLSTWVNLQDDDAELPTGGSKVPKSQNPKRTKPAR